MKSPILDHSTKQDISCYLSIAFVAGILLGILIGSSLKEPQRRATTAIDCAPCHTSAETQQAVKAERDLHDLRAKRGHIPGLHRADLEEARRRAAAEGQ